MSERPRRHRLLSEAEIELWVGVARTVAPRPGAMLPHPRTPPAPPAPKTEPVPAPAAVAPLPLPRGKPGPPPLAPIEKRLRRQLSRGQVDIDGAVDLHGCNQAEAHHRLHAFLRGAQARGARLVLVVTGKGRLRASAPGVYAAETTGGVLRRAVPLWLREEAVRPIVLGFEEASQPHGGTGALYVRLRKPAGR